MGTLVVVDDFSMESTHSMFFKSLTDRGYDLTFHKASDSDIPFRDHGEFLFDSLIVFAPKTDNWNEMDFSVNTVLEFIDSGKGNVLVAGDSTMNYFTSAMADECGAEFGSTGNFVIDHLAFDQSDFGGYHTVITADNFVDSDVLAGDLSPILYQGNGLSLRADNKLVFPILSGSPSSYCQNPEENDNHSLHASGRNLVLVAGLQARNNARVVLSGSVDMFSDNYFTAKILSKDGKSVSSGNADFATDLTQWVFGERGLIRVKSVSHHLVGETEQRDSYTVKENIVYTIEIEEFDGKKWVGYSGSNIQLELQMLDPYIRKTLTNQGNGVYSSTFQLPDVYGVFTFKVDYHRVGYTSVVERSLVTILPLRHTDYERFIPSAFPYYASAFSMMGGVALFSLIFLFSK